MNFVHKIILVNKVLRKKVAELEEFVYVFLSPMNFLTRSKKPIWSMVSLRSLEGGMAVGRLGTSVGDTGGISGAVGLA